MFANYNLELDKSLPDVKVAGKEKENLDEESLDRINEENVENDVSIHNISKTMEKDIAPEMKI